MASIDDTQEIGSWIVNLVVDDDNHLSILVNNEDQSRIYDTGADIGGEKEFAVRLTTAAIEELYKSEGDLRMSSIFRRLQIGSWDAILVVDDDNHLGIWVSNEDDSNVIDLGSDEEADNDFAVRLTTEAIEESCR